VTSVACVAHGAIHDYPFIASLIKNYDRCIAVDGGLLHCRAMNITPDLIIGDLDSSPPEILNLYPDVPIENFPTDKNKSDMELAIDAVNVPSVEKIAFFGALENRTDHTLANLFLLSRLPQKIVIETEKETLFCIEGKKRYPCHSGQTVSFFPFGSATKGVTSKGLKWELKGATLDKNFFSLSNVCLDNRFEITIEQGQLICCLQRL
jgi:thiamine pyrophosphokinase